GIPYGIQHRDLLGDRDLVGRPVQQEQIDLIDLQLVEALIDGGGEFRRAVFVDPDLGGQEQLVAARAGLLQGAAERGLVAGDLGGVEMAQTRFESGGSDALNLGIRHPEYAEAEDRNLCAMGLDRLHPALLSAPEMDPMLCSVRWGGR